MSTTFKISLSLSKKGDGSQVYYKIDGERFKENKTLKLHVNTTYRVSLECRPAIEVSSVSICSIKVDGSFTKKDASLSTYAGTWSSGMVQKTASKVRTFLPVLVVFEDGATIGTSLQCKLYPLKDQTHVIWGTGLKSIDLKCSRRQDENLISVDEVLFT